MPAEPIQSIIDETRDLESDEAFVSRYPYPFLIRETTAQTIPVAEDRSTTRLRGVAAAVVGDGFAERDVWVHRVCPRDVERAEEAVILGRDAGCDVVIEDGSISAVHARFTLDYDESSDETTFLVADAGSANGTFLNGERLQPDTPTEVSDQDSLRFGLAVKLQFFTAEGFFQFMSAYRRIKKIGQ